MADVEVRFFAAARAAVGAAALHVPAGSLASVLDRVVADHPDFGPVRVRCSFLLDGLAVHEESTPVRAGSTVDVLPPFAGG